MDQKSIPVPTSPSAGSSRDQRISASPEHSASGTAAVTHAAVDAVTHAAVDAGRELARDAKHLADDVGAQAKKTMESRLSTSKDRAADTLGTVAEALRHTGNHLQLQHEAGGVSSYVGQAADQVERASNYLQTRTLGEVVADVEHFARREPALFLGGAFVAGIVGGRFLKSSAPRRPSAQLSSGATGSPARASANTSSKPAGNGSKPNPGYQTNPSTSSTNPIPGGSQGGAARSAPSNASASAPSNAPASTTQGGGANQKGTPSMTNPSVPQGGSARPAGSPNGTSDARKGASDAATKPTGGA